MVQETRRLLQARKLRYTQPRAAILSAMMDLGTALSERDLETNLGDTCDRATIYRTLSTFLEHGIVHKVLDGEGGIKYAICTKECDSEHPHHHNHVHFKCHVCGETRCINQVSVPAIDLPAGFVFETVDTLVQGICPNCSR